MTLGGAGRGECHGGLTSMLPRWAAQVVAVLRRAAAAKSTISGGNVEVHQPVALCTWQRRRLWSGWPQRAQEAVRHAVATSGSHWWTSTRSRREGARSGRPTALATGGGLGVAMYAAVTVG